MLRFFLFISPPDSLRMFINSSITYTEQEYKKEFNEWLLKKYAKQVEEENELIKQ